MGEVGISVLLDGNLIQASGIARFTFIPTGKEYLLYTLNEKTVQDGVELNKLYVSETGEGNAQLSIIGQDDWVSIKGIMAEISKPNATIPNNIQLGVLSAKQYTVGPYKKIAVKDELKNGIIATQLAHQPSETTEVATPPVGNQYLESAPADITTNPVQVPSAFDMTAPVPEQTAPIALVNEQPTTPVEAVPQSEVIAPPTESTVTVQEPVVDIPAVPTPVVTQQVVTNVQPQADINQSVKEIINYTNSDVNKIIELFKANGLDISNISNVVTQPVETPVQTVEAVQTVETPAVAPSIDINNLPVATQPVEVPTATLSEESIVPSSPSLPVDNISDTNIITQNTISEPTIPVQPAIVQTQVVSEPTIPVQTVVAVPTVPVQQVVPTQTTIVQPTVVSEPTIPVQTVVAEPTVPVQTQVVSQPAETTIVQTPIVSEPTIPVQTQVVEQPVQPQNVVNEVITQTSMPAQSETAIITQDMQNSTVEFAIPQEPTQQVVTENVTGIPTILPLTAEDLQPAAPADTPAPVQGVPQQPTQPQQQVTQAPQSVEANTAAFIDTAGPVVKPIGQEDITATGTPGDSGQQ